jgi:SAM-dependent methyltransferase
MTRGMKQAARRAVQPLVIALRRHYYTGALSGSALSRLPAPWRAPLGLDDETARMSRRLEIGAGPHPQPGYLHVDTDLASAHLEAHAVAWKLPFPDDWATEILSIHALEHIRPTSLSRTLAEWYRVLAPNGVVRIHVPNTPALMRAYLATDEQSTKWMLSGALLGMYTGTGVRGPDDLIYPADHQVLFDATLLTDALARSGFTDVADLTDAVDDRHTIGWSAIVDRYSLVVEARKPIVA